MTTTVIDLTKPVETRSGVPVRILCTDRPTTLGFPVVALVGVVNPVCHNFTPLGQLSTNCKSDYDLVNCSDRKSVFMNLYHRPQKGEGNAGTKEAFCPVTDSLSASLQGCKTLTGSLKGEYQADTIELVYVEGVLTDVIIQNKRSQSK